mgnify:CR=1 FL=1
MMSFSIANLSIVAYNMAFVVFVHVCMALRIFPRHFGLPDGDSGFWFFGVIWFAGMIVVWFATYRAISKTN